MSIQICRILKINVLFLIFCLGLGIAQKPAQAASENACAIWICLPGGFPPTCAGAYSEFISRIRRGRPPLPPLSSCSTGPNGETTSGSYNLGYEPFEPCEEGFVLRVHPQVQNRGRCYAQSCAPAGFEGDGRFCNFYDAILRPKPNYVDMWVEGEFIGRYYY